MLGDPPLDDPRVRRLLASARPEVIVSFFFPRRIPAEVLALAPRGAFGTHPSLLPRWRGPDPYFWALREGDSETGVTLHRLDASYDTGAVIERRRVPISDRDDSWSLARKLDRPALALLLDAMARLAAGEALEGEPQPADGASWAARPTDEELAIDWRRPASEILRLIRAAAPEPGATAAFGERWVELLAATACDEEPPPGLRPSEAWRAAGGWAVRCGEGAIHPTRARGDEGPLDLEELFRSVVR